MVGLQTNFEKGTFKTPKGHKEASASGTSGRSQEKSRARKAGPAWRTDSVSRPLSRHPVGPVWETHAKRHFPGDSFCLRPVGLRLLIGSLWFRLLPGETCIPSIGTTSFKRGEHGIWAAWSQTKKIREAWHM